MRKTLKLIIIVTAIATFLGMGASAIAKEKKAPTRLPVSAKKVQPTPAIKTPVDLRITGVDVFPGYSAGPAIWPDIENRGPNTANGAIVCVKPGRDGREQCKTERQIRAGAVVTPLFLVEGGNRITITVKAGSKNIEEKTANNECTVFVNNYRRKPTGEQRDWNKKHWVRCQH